MVDNTLTPQKVAQFWDYETLWQLEKTLVPVEIQRIIFLGSGALPLTAIVAALDNKNLHITCIDVDSVAITLSQKLIQKLGLENQIQVIHTTAQKYSYTPEDFVICASLVEGKEDLYQTLYTHNVQNFMVRDAEGNYQFLYSPAPMPLVHQYSQIQKTTPNPHCINTTRLFGRV